MRLRFTYDIVCPFAYLASERLEALSARTGLQVQWCPVLLGGIYEHHGSDQVPAQEWAANKLAIGERDLEQQAASQGTPWSLNPLHPQRTVSAMRLITSATEAARPALSRDLFRAYHVHGQDINDRAVLAEIAGQHGLDLSALDKDSIKQTLRGRTAAAAKSGVFGVPTFQLGTRLWWGQDRLHLLEHALGGAGSKPLPSTGKKRRKTLTFYHDFSSPFSYLATTQIGRMAEAAGVKLKLKPVLLGALFRAIGTPDVPLFAMSEAKREYMLQDLGDWAKWWGVDFRFPEQFPLRTVAALRVALQDPSTTPHIYRAAWVQGKNIGDDDVLIDVLDAAGFDGVALLAGTQEQAIKQALRDNTEAAITEGACGVPTFTMGKQLWWGQDRLSLVEAALRS
jgi:2-hydroxychromene-2-carboxylate isomerase